MSNVAIEWYKTCCLTMKNNDLEDQSSVNQRTKSQPPKDAASEERDWYRKWRTIIISIPSTLGQLSPYEVLR